MMNDEEMQNGAYAMVQSLGGFEIEPCSASVNLFDPGKYTKLKLDSMQKMQVSSMIQQMPQAMASGTLAQAYVAKFPEGLPHTLTKLKQGGYGSMVRVDGKFAGSASFYPIQAQAVALGAFTAMSAVTGQYFLAEINSKLKLVNTKLDDIVSFLYGDKKAELMAEINFVKYVHENYASIMQHNEQRLATISSLQDAKKIAMKDIEFYLNDLERIVEKDTKDLSGYDSLTKEALSIKESLELSRQLYVLSGLLELYCAQNYDESYLSYIEQDVVSYINRCDSRINKCCGTLYGQLIAYKESPFEQKGRKEKLRKLVEQHLNPYQDGKDSPLRISLQKSLEMLHRKESYYLDQTAMSIFRRQIDQTQNRPQRMVLFSVFERASCHTVSYMLYCPGC